MNCDLFKLPTGMAIPGVRRDGTHVTFTVVKLPGVAIMLPCTVDLEPVLLHTRGGGDAALH